MSGLFQRLAAQAMGHGALVHSTARLPYAAAPTLLIEGEARESPATGPPPPDSEPIAARSVISTPSPTPTSGDVAGSPAPPSPLLPDAGRPAPRAQAEAEATPPRRLPVARSAPRMTPEPLVERARAQEPAGTPESRSGRMRDEADAPLVSEPAPTGWSAPPEIDRPRVAPALLPLRPSPPRARGVAAPVSHTADARDRAGDETRDIHVSIGRIEVTAVHEAPAPKRRAVRASQPMTLEEYLGRRRGTRP